ncbi:MAG: glycine--tRNA ligase subunit beta [Hyphomicrobiaceae bacterium]|nr:MAG: glycine--tRNA ligase subunit beta [Hyphomicrobiaceae bacterium]
MSELLLEILSEEIPARMQGEAAEALKRLVVDGLTAAGVTGGTAEAFATPRRLALAIEGLPAKSAEVSEERKGPRVGAPENAIAGFLKAASLKTIAEARVVKDAKKGDYYLAAIHKPGRATAQIIASLVPEVMTRFPWPKSMRWGEGATRWVRPVQSILCLLDGKVVPFEIEGVKSGHTTRGHRFLGSGEPIVVKGLADYRKALKAEKVILEAPARAERILSEARERAAEAKLTLVEDERLLAENAGLTEWPSVLVGAFDKEFLKVPPEVIITAIKTHQKCFALKEGKGGKLSNHFALVTNLKPKDGGEAIIKGNEKVIRARLSDARFFWEQDRAKKLEPMHFELKGITFHEKLGTQWDRMERITELARQIAGAVDAEPDLAGRAAQLCKADLVSGMVGEFPELQGLMGRYYAEAEHLHPRIAQAIEEHYKPKGPSDGVSKEPVSIAVALADKLDTLVGFWAIGEKPTGSGDPYQLRRAALGVIRIVLENDLRLPLTKEIERAFDLIWPKIKPQVRLLAVAISVTGEAPEPKSAVTSDLLAFFADRLKVHLREKGARHDLIDAVFSLGGQDDLALIVKRVEALDAFLRTDDGANLLAGVKRAVNIVKIEEKKDKASYEGQVSPDLLHEPAEKAIYTAIQKCAWDGKKAIEVENFKGAMAAVAEMRRPVDAFFDHVMVNVEEPALRKNRLLLLSAIRAATMQVADFSRIAG